MKINITVFTLCSILLFGCSHPDSKNNSYIKSIVDTLSIDKSKNILIYTINPNDCLNCINGFKSINNELSKIQNSKIYIVSVEREIERKELMKETTLFDFSKTDNKVVLWNKDIFNKINNSINKNLGLSSICIYNYKTNSIIYCKPIRDIGNKEDVILHLK
jgi:hypothetical protein